MSGGLPHAAVGAFAAVWIYSLICFTLCMLVVGLLVVYGEKWTYITMLAVFSAISTLASMVQQLHFAIEWESVKEAEFEKALRSVKTPSLALSGPAQEIDIVLFNIQFYCYNVMSIAILFWAVNLFCSAYSIGQRLLGSWVFYAPVASKIFAVVWPAFVVGVSTATTIINSTPAFFVITNITMLISMLVGSILLILILYKYMKTRRLLAGSARREGWFASNEGTSDSRDATSTMESGINSETRRSIYDRALVIRFTIGFVILAIFEAAIIIFSVFQTKTSAALVVAGEPDFSVASAISAIVFFIPGVTTSLVVFLVFGTAKSWRQYRNLITGCFGLRACMGERRTKAQSPVIGAQNRDFEFDRLPSLRNRESQEIIVLKTEVANRVRMFSETPIFENEDQYETGELSIFASERTTNAPAVRQFHRPLRTPVEQVQRPAQVASRRDSAADRAADRAAQQYDVEDHGIQYGPIVREEGSNSADTKRFVGQRVTQRSPEAYLDDSSD